MKKIQSLKYFNFTIKKIIGYLLFILISIPFYILITFKTNETIFYICSILHVVLSFFVIFNKQKKTIILKILILVNLILLLLNIIPFPTCNVYSKNFVVYKCDCTGIKIRSMFVEYCAGVRNDCYVNLDRKNEFKPINCSEINHKEQEIENNIIYQIYNIIS